jgi:hypothetical protein
VDEINVYGVLAPDTDYYWDIEDHFGNHYLLPFTTDEDGLGKITTSQLPEGFLNPGMKPFKIRVKSDLQACEYEKVSFVVKYDTIHVGIQKMNIEKKYVGCPIDIQLPERFSSERFQFVGAEDQTEYPVVSMTNYATVKSKLTNVKQLLVFNEAGILRAAASQGAMAADEYYYDAVNGIIYFGQTIADQELTILSFK